MSQAEAQELSRVWNVPIARTPNFTGRADELDRLHQLFASRAPGATLQAIHGLGGIGKTQLALEYAYTYARSYDVVWWLRAEEPATLAADFADLAVAQGIRGRMEPEQRAVIEAVKHWLSHNGRWLLVFDSVKDPKDIVPYLPAGSLGHVLVTSRHASWRGVAMSISLRGLKRADSAALLLARTGAGPDQEGAARELAEALGDLPLALAQAGAYIEEAGIGVADYLARFRERRAELMRCGAEGDSAPTVATTWDIAFRDAQARSPAAGELLDLCAFLAPEDIPRDALRLGAAGFPAALAAAAVDPFALDEAIKALRRYSLIDVNDDALSVHRLVQAAVRDRLGEDTRRVWAERAVSFVCNVFPTEPDELAVRATARRWLPHARAALAHARAAAVPAIEASERLLRHAANYQHICGLDADAREMLEQALVMAEAIHGPDHPHVAIALTGLGPVLKGLGDLESARIHAERALAIDEANLGKDSAQVATDAVNLAGVLLPLGELEQARRYAERALAIDEALGPAYATAVARDANNLGAVLRAQGHLEEARRQVERALAIDEQHRRTDDPELALHLNNLGFLLRELGDRHGAKEKLDRALAIGKAAFGDDDPNVATYHSNLASVLQELGELQEARTHFERAVAIGVEIYGDDHYAVAIRRNNLGLVLMDLGDLRGAREQLVAAVAIAKKQLGPEHRRVKKLENNLASIERRLLGPTR